MRRECGLRVARLLQGEAEVAVCVGHARRERGSAPVLGDRLVQPTQAAQRVAGIVAQRGAVRRVTQSGPAGVEGVAVPLELVEQLGQVVPGRRVVGTRLQRRVICGDGLGDGPRLRQGVAVVIVGGGEIGPQGDGGAETGDSTFEIAEPAQGRAEVAEGVCVSGIMVAGLREGCRRLAQPVLANQSDAAVVRFPRICRRVLSLVLHRLSFPSDDGYEVGRPADAGLAANLRHRHPVLALLDDKRLLRIRELRRTAPNGAIFPQRKDTR